MENTSNLGSNHVTLSNNTITIPAEAKVLQDAVTDVLDRGISLRAVAADLRGHGESAKLYDAAEYSIPIMSGDIVALMVLVHQTTVHNLITAVNNGEVKTA